MSKPFLTYQQQLQKLITEKHLIISNTAFAEQKLRDIGYFTLIGGYKTPFQDPATRHYRPGTTFEDVYALYQFDNDLRELVLHHLNLVERKLRSLTLEQHLKVLVLYRNVCAHNERLFSHRIYSEIPDTILHQKLKIPQKGSQYKMGKRDLFSVVIALRYLLPRSDFLLFKQKLSRSISKFLKKSLRITEQQLLDMMGFPENWKQITRYKL